MTSTLIESIFLPLIGNDVLNQLEDAAILTAGNCDLAVTTDSYVVSPIFFPGGNIGSLAVHGTVNDLAMRAAVPLAMTVAFILEEGFPLDDLTRALTSMKEAAEAVGILLIAADTKVVGRGAADKLFITTTGIGLIKQSPAPSVKRAMPGDKIIVNGDIGRHGIAVMTARENLELDTAITTDSAPLNQIVQEMLAIETNIHCLRDITRGGLASVLNEIAQFSNVGMVIQENLIPVHPEVKAVCELLGLDPLYVACEGRFITIASPDKENELIELMSRQVHGHGSCVIGQVVDEHLGRVVMRSRVGGKRIVDKLSGEQLPRIC